MFVSVYEARFLPLDTGTVCPNGQRVERFLRTTGTESLGSPASLCLCLMTDVWGSILGGSYLWGNTECVRGSRQQK